MDSLFGHASLDDRSYREWLTGQLAAHSDEWLRSHHLNSQQTRRSPRLTVEARASVLKAVYGGDYHTDSFDVSRLAGRVADGSERVWFWGDPEELRRVTCQAADGTERRVPRLGTVSVLDATAEFGPGHLELCRSGSLSGVAATPFSVLRVLEFLRGDFDGQGRAESLVLVPRVRVSSEGIRGGEAVNKLHREKIRSWFWGFAPWYVMQGGFLEILEFREVVRDRLAVLAALELGSLFFHDDDDRRYIDALLQHNFSGTCAQLTTLSRDEGRTEYYVDQVSHSPANLRPFNHVTLAARPGARTPISLALRSSRIYAATVVRVDLAEPASAGIQGFLSRNGFILTCFSPGKVFGKGSRSEMWGYWSRPNPSLSVAPPYYWGQPSLSANDAVILERLTTLCRCAEGNASHVGKAGSGAVPGPASQRLELARSE